jgi:hypothetical protein
MSVAFGVGMKVSARVVWAARRKREVCKMVVGWVRTRMDWSCSVY